jgi:chromatin-remodeling ATPase INO80
MYPEHQQSITGIKRRRRKFEKKPIKLTKKLQIEKDDSSNDMNDIDWEDQITMSIKEEDGDSRPQSPSGRGRKRKSLFKTPELMNHRRRKVWQTMAKKEIGKFQRTKANNHKEMLQNCKKTATLCQKVARQKAMESQKRQKETIWRAKRLTREMLSYWKKFDRVERENRRRLEKEAEEQRKMDVELVEVKRQQRKLNFLITQTELYAHFMSNKGELSSQEEQRILNQLDEEVPPRLATIDNYDSELMKSKAQKNVQDAFVIDRNRTREFDKVAHAPMLHPVVDQASGSIVELPQPDCFKGVLKGYQLKGMTWLAHLYDQGISGILVSL